MSDIDAYLEEYRRAREAELAERQPWTRRKRPWDAVRNFFGGKESQEHHATAPIDTPDYVPPEEEIAAPKKRGWRWWTLRGLGIGIGLFLAIIVWLAITAPLSKSLEPIAAPEITLTTSDGAPIARNGAIVRDPVVADDLPDYVKQAFLAIEDRRFYDHWGVDPRGVGRAIWSNVAGSGLTQGGSTITQQLAKISFLTPERSLSRKAREALIAFWMEAWLTKDEILERYLSNAYFGDNVYGLRAASLHYFYRQPENLKPEQALMLAGLVQAPSRYAPTRNWDAATKRDKLVRKAMVAAGFMTQAEVDALPVPVLDVRNKRKAVPVGTHFADWAMPQARELTETSYATLELETTLDSWLQRIAERAVQRGVTGDTQVALVAMRPNGEVVAMVGGRDYTTSQFNRAVQAERQSGSAFKLFVWLAALRSGMRPDTVVDDSPIESGTYRPKNAGEKYIGRTTLEEAFVKSSNVVAVRLYNRLGSEAVSREARNLGVTANFIDGDPSQALGTASTSLIEMTAAYAALAGNAYPVTPTAFAEGEQGWFDWLFSGPESFDRQMRDDMQQMLRAAVNRGTGRAAQLAIPNYGKTGTSQDNRDALFIGYAGEGANRLVVGVWVGNDDNSPLAGIQGGGLPARIWKRFMAQALKGSAPAGKRRTPAKKATPSKETPTQPRPGDAANDDLPSIANDNEDSDEKTRIRLDENGLVISRKIDGRNVRLRLGNDEE
ncbi:MAG: transglycosylase domain-containing protein [Pseudomonadota bacterium]